MDPLKTSNTHQYLISLLPFVTMAPLKKDNTSQRENVHISLLQFVFGDC